MVCLESHMPASYLLVISPENQDFKVVFNGIFYISVDIYPINGFTCNWSHTLFCKDAGIIIFLLFITIPSMTITSSLKDQYCCTSFMASAPLYDQACITQVNSIPRWSSCRITHLVSSVVMHSRMSVHVLVEFRLTPVIFSSQFSLWLCHDNQSAINTWILTCTGSLCCIDGYVVRFFVACVTESLQFSLRLPPVVCDL